MRDDIELVHNGVKARVYKRVVHRWRTDVMIDWNGRAACLCRLEGGETRREIRELALRWLTRNAQAALRPDHDS